MLGRDSTSALLVCTSALTRAAICEGVTFSVESRTMLSALPPGGTGISEPRLKDWLPFLMSHCTPSSFRPSWLISSTRPSTYTWRAGRSMVSRMSRRIFTSCSG